MRSSAAHGFIAMLVLLSAITLCAQFDGGDSTATSLQLRQTIPVPVREPSGLALDFRGRHLWTVSDTTNRIYKLGFDGMLLDSLSYLGEDLEGITQNTTDGTLWVVEERRREVVNVDTLGRELRRVKIPVKQKKSNRGLEGIVFYPKKQHLFLLNEKSPKLLIELDDEQGVVSFRKLKFAKDFSGLAYDRRQHCLWIASDLSRSVTKWSLIGEPLASYRHDIDKAEGIAIDGERGILYLISDSQDELYLFDPPE